MHNTSRGYTLLFAIIAASLVLQITIAVLTISRKEFLAGTTARESMYAIYAADTGIECAVMANLSTTTATSFSCAGAGPFDVTPSSWTLTGTESLYEFVLPVENSCAKVSVKKIYNVGNSFFTVVEARGYSVGDETQCPKVTSKTVERAMRLTY